MRLDILLVVESRKQQALLQRSQRCGRACSIAEVPGLLATAGVLSLESLIISVTLPACQNSGTTPR